MYPDNRYAEPIFIYCYKVINNSEVSPFFTLVFPHFSHLNNNKTVEIKFSCKILSVKFNLKNILFIKSIISNTDINNKLNNVYVMSNNVFKWRNKGQKSINLILNYSL